MKVVSTQKQEEDKVVDMEEFLAQKELEKGMEEYIADLVDSWVEKTETIKRKEQDLRREIIEIEGEMSKLEARIMEYAEEKGLVSIPGNKTTGVEIVPSTRNKIDPEAFLQFLAKQKKKEAFWNYVQIMTGPALKDFGGRILEAAGVLTRSTNLFGRLRARKNEYI